MMQSLEYSLQNELMPFLFSFLLFSTLINDADPSRMYILLRMFRCDVHVCIGVLPICDQQLDSGGWQEYHNAIVSTCRSGNSGSRRHGNYGSHPPALIYRRLPPKACQQYRGMKNGRPKWYTQSPQSLLIEWKCFIMYYTTRL